jgi:hypothetical protein
MRVRETGNQLDTERLSSGLTELIALLYVALCHIV